MGFRNRLVGWTAAILLVIGLAAFAAAVVPEMQVVRVKAKMEAGEVLTAAELNLAEQINATSTSYIDLNAAQERAKARAVGRDVSPPRRPHNPLDTWIWTEVVYNWVDISQTGTPSGASGDDMFTGPFPLPFTFNYFDQDYTQFWVCTNGWISFIPPQSVNYWNGPIPDPEVPNAVLFGFWDDLYVDPNTMWVKYLADSTNNRLIVSWNCRRLGGSAVFQFQIIVNQSGTVVYQYASIPELVNNCGVGLENETGTDGLQVVDNGNGTMPSAEWAILLGEPDGVPEPVTNATATPNGTTVVFAWTDPTEDTNGGPITTDSVQISLADQVVGTVAGGVQTYTQTDAPQGNLFYTIRAWNDGYGSLPVGLNVVVGNATYAEDFELTNGMWVANPEGGWQWGEPTNPSGPGGAHSGTNVWAVGLTTNYGNSVCYNMDLALDLEVANAGATVEFWMWYSCESWWDGTNFQVSIDGGNTFQVVVPEGGYPEDQFSTSNACIPGQQGWSATSGGWIYVVIPLADFVGEVPIFRFSFGSDGSVTLPGFFIDDMTIWGLEEPVGAPVSGTVVLDGGLGNVTQAVVRASGVGNPTTNPAADGSYTLANVQTGDRMVSATLAGYNTASQAVTIPEGGLNNVNLTLRRLDPPAPTGLTVAVNADNGAATLNWADAADPTVDLYHVYRKLREDADYTLVQTVEGITNSQAVDSLTAPGVYHWVVTAVDTNVSAPAVESEYSNRVEGIYGELPPHGLWARGNFDDHIHLQWFAPTDPLMAELSYDDGTADTTRGLGWTSRPNFGWMASKYQAEGPVTVYRLRVYFTDSAQVGDSVQVCLFDDDGTGRPSLTPTNVVTFQHAAPLEDFREIELDAPVEFLSGIFYVGTRQVTERPVCIGTDSESQFLNGTFFYAYYPWSWSPFEPSIMVVPMQRALVQIADGALAELSPVGGQPATLRNPVESSPWAAALSQPELSKEEYQRQLEVSALSYCSDMNSPAARAILERNSSFAAAPRAPRAEAVRPRDGGSTLDDLDYYIVYRDGADVGHPTTTFFDDFVAEGTEHSYYVTGHYDNGAESGPTATVTSTAVMAPGAPTNVEGLGLNTTQIRISWMDPTTNADGTPCTDLANVRVYRDGELIATVNSGVQQYVDAPPLPNRTYVWTVRGIDEVPNEGPAGSYTGSVIMPWIESTYEWVDISGTGTPILVCDDCNQGPFALGFNFPFYGQQYNQIRICSNGWMSFTSTFGSLWIPCIPNVGEPNALISMFTTDLNPGQGGQVLYYADPADESFVVSWVNVPHYFNTGSYTFQAILRPDGSIKFNYQAMTDNNCVVGVENQNGSQGLGLWCQSTGDWAPANETAVEFWGTPPVYATVSGTVTLDGGNGNVTAATVRANGISQPTANPAADGSYTLNNVVVGNRRLTASLTGYVTDTILVAVPEGGLTGQDFVLRREAPPAPTGFTASINSANRAVSMNWTDSPDLLVDGYKVYRKLQSATQWTLARQRWGRNNSDATDTLSADGIFQYVVCAVDTNITPPAVESVHSDTVAVISGHLPATSLTWDGNFDDRVRLTWSSPAGEPALQVGYDNGLNSPRADGLGWRGTQPAAGWILTRFEAHHAVTVDGLRAFFTREAPVGDAVEIAVFAADGMGLPARTPLATAHGVISEPLNSYQEFRLDEPVVVESGTFFVGVRQTTNRALGLGADELSPFALRTFFYDRDGQSWQTFEPELAAVPMIRALVHGQMDGVTMAARLEHAPLRQRVPELPFSKLHKAAGATTLTAGRSDLPVANIGEKTEQPAPAELAFRSAMSTGDLRRQANRLETAVDQPQPTVLILPSRRDAGTLDDILRFRIYRDGTVYDSVAATVTTYDDDGSPGNPLPENQPHLYHVRVVYNDNQESGQSNQVNARANMAPGAPTGLSLSPVGQTQMRVQWTDPTTNMDNTACVDLDSIRIYRNDVRVGAVDAGIGQFVDTPPDPTMVYTWSVKGVDEVPNLGPSADASGSVQSPWQQAEYEWVDISGTGTPILVCDDCNQGPFALGFAFPFYGETYADVRVCSNGWLSFTSSSNSLWIPCIPNTGDPNALISLFTTDLHPGNGGQVLYYSDAAEQRFIVSWNNVPHYPNTGSYTFQVILDASGSVKFNYQSMTNNQSVVGVEDASGSEGVGLWCQSTGDWTPQNNTAVEFWGGPAGDLTGVVRAFGTNLAIENVRVWATGWVDTVRTDQTGTYSLGMDPGTYTVHFEHEHFCDSTITGVVIVDGESTVRDMRLRAPQAVFDVTSLTFEVYQNTVVRDTFHISNSNGQCPLDYVITDTSAWVSCEPAQGFINAGQQAAIVVTVNAQGVPVGERHSALRVVYNAAGSPRSIPIDADVLTIDEPGAPLPTEYALRQNYPNPFNASTALRFDVPREGHVRLVIYNVMGQEVARPVDTKLSAGRHRVLFQATDLPSGLYLVRMDADGFSAVGKLMLLK